MNESYEEIKALSHNHKGTWCWLRDILCQEGLCNNCQIYLETKEQKELRWVGSVKERLGR